MRERPKLACRGSPAARVALSAVRQVPMEAEPQFSVHVVPGGSLVTCQGSINSHSTVITRRQTEAPSKKHGDPFPQALDGRPDDASSYAQVEADSKPRLAEMHGVLAAPPPMLSSR